MGRSSVFSLEQIYRKQVVGTWSNIPEAFRYIKNVGTSFGYTAGGNVGSKVDRVDYSNDTATASTKGPLSKSGHGLAATGNLDYGYVGWGWWQPGPASYDTNVDRVDYSNDTATATPKGPLSGPVKYKRSATGNQSFGYFAAGGPGTFTAVFRVDYSNDTATAPAVGSLPDGEHGTAATGNESFGYIGGIWPNKSTVSRIDYSNDSATASPKGPLSQGRNEHGATGNASFGYFGGGANPSPKLSTVDRIDYSNDTGTAPAKGPLDRSVDRVAATGNSSSGYWSGGRSPGDSSAISRVDYSSDTSTASPKGNLSGVQSWHASTSSRINGFPTFVPATRTETGYASSGTPYGYWAGGHNPYVSSIIQRLDFANDTGTMSGRTNLSHPKFAMAGSVSSTSFGYFVGGYGPAYQSGIDRLDYSNDTATATPTGTITNPTQSQGSAGTNSYGYIAGGIKSPGYSYLSSVERLDYSSDSSTTSKGPLNVPKLGLAGMGNSSYGWFAGGITPGSPNYVISKTDRVDYSNDTATSSPKGNLSRNVGNVPAAAGNSDYGWISGGRQISGFVKFSTVDRIDYSNDTATATPKGPLPATRYSNSATGNTSYGWHGAGKDPSGTSNVYRIDYSNDTASASTRGPLAATNYGIGATSSRENALPTIGPKTVDKGADGYTTTSEGPAYGYMCGGRNPAESPSDAVQTLIDRIDYSNDTATASPKGALYVRRNNHAAVGNKDYLYNGGGGYGSPTTSKIDRLDYASDTSTAAEKGPLSSARYYLAAVGNASYGYFAGGYPGNKSTVDRVDYSSDTDTASPKGPLSSGRYGAGGTSNASYGWIAGVRYPQKSIVDRIDFSNDTATSSPKGPMASANGYKAGTGNANFGYFYGGYPAFTNVERIDYSNDTATATVVTTFSTSNKNRAGATGSASFGYFAGGANGDKSIVQKIDYDNDTAALSPKGPLSAGRYSIAGGSSRENALPTASFIPRIRWVDSASQVPAPSVGPAFAYFGGGAPGPALSSTERLDYNNDTATASPKGTLSSAKYGAASTGSTTHGYWGAGSPHPGISTVDRIDYSNDTGAASVRGPLNQSTYMQGAMSSLTHGYWVGGVDMPSRVNRVDFSNDTVTAPQVGNLDHPNYAYNPGAAGNTTHGYVIGGTNAATSKVTRIDFSNDTATPSPVGNLSQKNTSFGTAGNANFAYTGGGEPGVYTSIVNRIEYANDTATALVKGPLTSVKTRVTASGNANFGYWVGGATPTVLTTIDRIEYANDTVTATPKGNLGTPRRFMGTAGASAKANAYPQEAVVAPVQPPFPFPEQLPVPPNPYGFDAESASSISGTIGSYSRTGTYCDPETDLATGITYGSQDSTPFDTNTDWNSEIVRCYSFTNYSSRTFAAAICALCEKPPQGGVWPISNNWESAWWIQSGNDDSDILIVVFDSVKTFSGVEISSPARQYGASDDVVYAVRLTGSASSFTEYAIGNVAYDGSTTATISASFEAQAIAIYRDGASGWARVGNIRFLK